MKHNYRTVSMNRLPRDAESKCLQTQDTQQTQQGLHNAYNQQRVIEAEQIESKLNEISGLMSKLATIVHDQRQTILTISENVEDATLHVEGAIEQLQKYLSSLSGNR